MPHWLVKTEPDCYSFAQLQQEKRAVWDGVENALALKHIRNMQVGDQVLIYHTGKEKAAVGIAKVAQAPYADPKAKDDRLAVVDLQAVKSLPHPVSLAAIKADPRFQGWDLVRLPRLSVMPVTPAQWQAVLDLSATDH